MLKKSISILISLLLVFSLVSTGKSAYASGEDAGAGTWADPYVVTSFGSLSEIMGESGSATVYIRLGADIVDNNADGVGPIEVRGKKCIDLAGYTIKARLSFSTYKPSYSLFVIEPGAALTLEDSEGGGEVIYDRRIPSMNETNAYTDVFLDRPVTVFEVGGTLTVNGGEITAGHYESEYYTYTDGFTYASTSATPGKVNSITPGNAVVVNSGGTFRSKGGEYYGRGFVMDDEGGKESACAAVVLNNGATAEIYYGEFYGKSNADVFSVSSGASIKVYSGGFHARYDSMITADKQHGVAYWLNVDCGMIGIPLRAFANGRESYTHIYQGENEYHWTASYTSGDDESFKKYGASGTGADLTVETLVGDGTKNNPFLLKNAADIQNLMHRDRRSKVYIRLDNDILDAEGSFTVVGNIVLDLYGHKLMEKLDFGATLTHYTLFTIEAGSSLTIEDSKGNGEIIYDRFIPSMNEANEQTAIFLYRTLTVFAVNGTLTVNSGEITAGHYESENYSFIKQFNSGGSTFPGTVNSITPGTAVLVNEGGRFVANGGEFYGRGFTINDNGEKNFVCAAVRLDNGAYAIINGGKFFGKSNADVFNVAWGSSLRVYSGLFRAEYDNRITVDKTNNTAYYVNVDCGRVGIPLHAFSHPKGERAIIKVDGTEYPFSYSYTNKQSDDFEDLGKDGTGLTITVEPQTEWTTKIVREDGIEAGLTYDPLEHFEIINTDIEYYNESYGAIPAWIHGFLYSWRVTKYVGSAWVDVEYEDDAVVNNKNLRTDTNVLDLYDLARWLKGGMEEGARYRITALASEYYSDYDGNHTIYSTSDDYFELDCRYKNIGDISLPDSLTGIVWPEHEKYAINIGLEQEEYTVKLTFEEYQRGVWKRMSASSGRFQRQKDKQYRLKVQITPKQFYRFSEEFDVTVGGKTVENITLTNGVLTGTIMLEVKPAVMRSVIISGAVNEGTTLSSNSPLKASNAYVTLSTQWERNGEAYTGAALYGEYRAGITLNVSDPYAFDENTVIMVFGKNYTMTNLSQDGKTGFIYTDAQTVSCSHDGNTNGWTTDAEGHRSVCSVCGEVLTSGPHSFGDWVSGGAVDIRTCKICGYKESAPNDNVKCPGIRLTGAYPVAGNELPHLEIIEADSEYAVIEYKDPSNEIEWFIDEVNFTNAIPENAVMQEGHVYFAQIKLHPKDGYYFADGAGLVSLPIGSSETQYRAVLWNYMEAVIKFTPMKAATAQFTLNKPEIGMTYGEFFKGFDGVSGGVRKRLTFTVHKDGKSLIEFNSNHSPDSGWVPSGVSAEFLSQKVEPGAEYKVQISISDGSQSFAAEDVAILNPDCADSASVTAATGSLCTVTAYFHLPDPDIKGDGKVDTADVSELIKRALFGDGEIDMSMDINGDGEVDCIDALWLMKKGSFTDPDQTPEYFIAASYDKNDKLTSLRLIDLGGDISGVDLDFLKTAAKIRLFYLNGQGAPAAEAFVYSIIDKQGD